MVQVATAEPEGHGPFEQLSAACKCHGCSTWCVKTRALDAAKKTCPSRLVPVVRRGGAPLKSVEESMSHLRKLRRESCTLQICCRSRSPHRCWERGCLPSPVQSVTRARLPATTPGVRCSTT